MPWIADHAWHGATLVRDQPQIRCRRGKHAAARLGTATVNPAAIWSAATAVGLVFRRATTAQMMLHRPCCRCRPGTANQRCCVPTSLERGHWINGIRMKRAIAHVPALQSLPWPLARWRQSRGGSGTAASLHIGLFCDQAAAAQFYHSEKVMHATPPMCSFVVCCQAGPFSRSVHGDAAAGGGIRIRHIGATGRIRFIVTRIPPGGGSSWRCASALPPGCASARSSARRPSRSAQTRPW